MKLQVVIVSSYSQSPPDRKSSKLPHFSLPQTEKLPKLPPPLEASTAALVCIFSSILNGS